MSLYGSHAAGRLNKGKAFASGTLTPADEDVDVVSGLDVVDHCGVSLAGVPAATHAFSIATPSATTPGSVRIRSYEDDYTVSTTEVAVTWWAVGDE